MFSLGRSGCPDAFPALDKGSVYIVRFQMCVKKNVEQRAFRDTKTVSEMAPGIKFHHQPLCSVTV